MVNKVRTLNFLPEVFRTPTNAQFLAASLDVITSQPDLKRVEGFIGDKYGYGIEPTDKYVVEPTKTRRDYQLDPSVVFLKPETQTAQDFINYPGIVKALQNQGGITDNNDRLFENQFYSWDSFIDLDKAVNFNQYYWIPNGPDAVEVSNTTLYLNKEYSVTQSDNGFRMASVAGLNPTLTLLRGGTYTFVVDQTTKFWIQGQPGLTGYDTQNNISTRDVLGVSNNGAEIGTVTFTVPSRTAQQQYDLPGNNSVDIATSLQFNQINGVSTSALTNIDGVTQLVGKTLMFYNNGDLATQVYFYTIGVSAGNYTLTQSGGITNGQKITVATGTTYANRNFYRDTAGAIQLVPYLSAQLDTLYYQDGTDPLSVGVINLVESNTQNILDINNIIGRKNYTSPNGVTFINGLKVIFKGSVTPSSYADKEYYVDGVGTAITLLPVDTYLATENDQGGLYITWSTTEWSTYPWDLILYVPIEPEYLTISRNSRDRNAWTRANRWFNKEVIDATIAYNGVLSKIPANTATKAQRPILEFQGNLRLWNSGTDFLSFVDVLDTTTTDALSTVQGQTEFMVDGQLLTNDQTVVFKNDNDESTRRTVYQVKFIKTSPTSDYVISLAPVITVTQDEQQIAISGGKTQVGTTWRFVDAVWIQNQKKTITNQAPLFDIFDANQISIGNEAYYVGSTFKGTKLFSYTPGTGSNDPVLGFPILYSSITNIGDIQFTVNLNTDTFNYVIVDTSTTKNINIGYVHYLPTVDAVVERTGWVKAAGPSIQYQVFEFSTTQTQAEFVCDIPAVPQSEVTWANTQVYYNDNILDKSQYTVAIGSESTTITLNVAAVADSKVTVLVYSKSVSKNAYYGIPANLQNNPFNTNVTTVDVGDLRNQYRTIFSNAPAVTGQLFGENNIYNLGNLNSYGTAIIQNSASLVLPGVFLRKSSLNIFDAIQYSSNEYTSYKQQLVDVTNQNDFGVYQTPAEMLDTVIYQISTTKNSEDAFFWSDMVFSGSPYRNNTYSFAASTPSATFALSDLWTPTWFEQANFRGLGIYVTRTTNGYTVTTQLTINVDYVVSTVSPSVTVTYDILAGDTVTIKEYNQTYGSYCPNTPTKLGLYNAFIPAIVLNNTYTTPTWFIQGHDGSYTKLYGTYDSTTGRLSDFRDQVIFEFENRVYNNLKVTGVIPLQAEEIFPGEFRTTDYARSELLEMYSINFLNWVGTNRVDYKEQVYNLANEFTYNYNESTNRLTGDTLQQGYWRGIYNWLYDSNNPANAPWEMLGLVNKPTWWDTRYGAPPYTSGNTLMWTEIAAGYVWNNGESYVNPLRVRPQLLSILPVDADGALVSPFASIVGNYDRLTFNRNWVIGDEGPTETTYLKSSTWPFDLMRLLALTKPAKFFNLFVDRDLYKYNSSFEQYLYEERYHLDPRTVQVYGNGVSKASYINWVVDYVDQHGVDGTDLVTTTLKNLDVRLTYSIAGFSAKNYLQFLIEKSTPETRNTSLLIPDESYSVLLYDNVPEAKITYSSVIIQRTPTGWAVYGNSQNKQYFTLVVPKSGPYERITVGDTTVKVSKDYYADRFVTVPYGTNFYSIQGVSEFLINYGRYLSEQGVLFNYVDKSVLFDWTQMTREFINWTKQGWEVGTTISLNPDAKLFSVLHEGLVVQPLTIQQQNFILNQNLLPLQSQNAAIVREGESFSVAVLSEGDAVAYTNLNLSSIEHVVVFDNYTAFNDTIYNPTTGLRQSRLMLKGYKTAAWNGYVDASGFIINEDNIQEWQANVKYAKGQIVTYKAKYWAAEMLIEPAAEFSKEQWREINYDDIKTGLLPNPSTNAYESLYYYDSTRANLANDADLLSFSLIGYRPRQYLVDADLSDITQINVYKNIVTEKGTNLLVNAFKEANLAQGQIDYSVKENWAIKNGDFGAVLNSNFVECLLDQNILTGNPTIIGFVTNGTVADAQQTVLMRDLINYERPPLSQNFLPVFTGVYTDERGLPTAGYVNLNDAKFTAYSLLDLNDSASNANDLYRSDIVWLASYKSSWNVFTPQSLNTTLTTVVNNFDNTVTLTFATPHGLLKDDPFVVVNFSTYVNGYYTVQKINSLNSLTISKAMPTNVTKLTGQGAAFKLISRRFAQASDIANNLLPNSAFYTKRFWVDSDADDQWAVWANGPVFSETTVPFASTINNLGTSVAYTNSIGTLAGDSANGTIYRYQSGIAVQTVTVGGSNLGVSIQAVDDTVFASSSTTNQVYVYKLVNNLLEQKQVISVANTNGLAVSADLNWLYVANYNSGVIYVYMLRNGSYVYANQISTPAPGAAWAYSIACSTDGVKLIVGAPNETVNSVAGSGTAYVYTRGLQRFDAVGNQTVFNTTATIPNNRAIVLVNDVAVTAAISGTTVTLSTPAAEGDIVEVDFGSLTFVQQVTGTSTNVGAYFGISVDTNRYGADFVVGAPYSVETVNSIPNVEGSVYRYTNSGQRYGVVYGTVNGTQSGTIYIDGFEVNFAGTIEQIAAQINSQTDTNVLASYVDNSLTIGVIRGTADVVNNIIDVTGSITELSKLGITPYTKTQVIYNPDSIETSDSQNGRLNSSSFGLTIAMNERDSMIVGAPTGNRRSETTFDYSDDLVDNDTIFDNGMTTYVDTFKNTGVVFEYDYLPASSENIYNPGQYVFGQYIQIKDVVGVSQNPKFGQALDYNDGVMTVSAPTWYATGAGRITSAVAVGHPSSWYVDKRPLPMVDVNGLQDISIYNVINNETLEFLDYIDPVQGKLLGAVSTNIDYIGSKDPATYGVGVEWMAQYVGKTWLDTSNLRILNYNQPDITYNATNWGRAFPGSMADVYTWVVSNELPVNYTGPGYVTNYNDYVEATTYDRNTNSLQTVYYYWVKSLDVVPPNKTLSPITISQYLLNPLTSGIAYLAGITTNVVALMNSGSSIQANSSALHIGYQTGTTDDQIHTSWELIATDDAESFLSGVPSSISGNPNGLYLKYLDSFAGQNQQGAFVPDRNLTPLKRYGVAFKPRQSMFVDRLNALKNYVQFVNDIMIKIPVVETRNLYFLNKVTDTYDTRNYWTYANWWATGYSDSTKITIEVATYTDLLRLTDNQTVGGNQSVVIVLKDGLIARVKNNQAGRAEVYVYTTAAGWTRIGLEKGTIQILNTIWTEPIGWASTTWSTGLWDKTLYMETYNIIRWINEQLLIDDLLLERNNSLMLMFNLIQSDSLEQQNYLPWLTKTSLVDVSHRVRDLYPYKSYQRDNYEFLTGYLNEIKPYHVVFKDFKFTFNGLDTYPGNLTDFDLPAQYNSTTGQFESPQLVYQQTYEQNQYLPTNGIWTEQQYSEWFNNYGLSVAATETGVTTLTAYVAPESTAISVASVYGLPETGSIVIGTETITYNSVDRIHNTLVGVVRSAPELSHLPGTTVSAALPAVIVLDQGRGYTEPPRVSAYIDTDLFPTPREVASFTAEIALDRVISVAVNASGSGYATAPKIVIQGSTISGTFASTAIDTTFNTITIANHDFVTGDPVVYSAELTSTIPAGLTAGEYYYVRSIDSNTVALYNSYADAINTDMYPLVDDRVHFGTTGSATDNTLTVTARAVCFTTSQPVREVKTTVKFDRVSYGTRITNWQENEFYAGAFTDPIGAASSGLLVTDGLPWDYLRWDSWSWNPYLLASDAGAILSITDVQPLQTSSTTFATILTLDYIMTALQPGQLTGLQFTVYDGGWTNPTTYYLKPVNSEQAVVYRDQSYTSPVPYSEFGYVAGAIAYASEPFTVQQSLVKYANKLWKCVVSNNDSTFDYDKWVQVYSDDPSLTAADRIAAFYDPTANMPGIDLRQLMTGITYPNTVISGSVFATQDKWGDYSWSYTAWDDFNNNPPVDAIVKAPAFNYDPITNPTVYDVQGGLFSDGYGPEEMVSGIVTDNLDMYVSDSYNEADPGTPIPDNWQYRLSVNKYGQPTVYNTNSSTRTAVAEDFYSTDSVDDVIYLDDASVVVDTYSFSVTTAADGSVLVNVVDPSKVTGIVILNGSTPVTNFEMNPMLINGVPVDPPNPQQIRIVTPDDANTALNITVYVGNVVIINSEYIGFTSINVAENSITGLHRGLNGTITNRYIASGSTVYSVLANNKMDAEYYSQWWYSTGLTEPMYNTANTNLAAEFLRLA